MLRYANYAADRMDVRRHYRFNTRVDAASYNESKSCWRVTLDSGEVVSCRLLMAE